jgi:hypothetical protein
MATTTWITLASFHEEIDGKYELDWSFTKRHWRTIKKMADVTPPELIREIQRSNVDLVVALAAVALEQAGKPVIPEMLWKDDGEIKLSEETDADARPPDHENLSAPTSTVEPSGSNTAETGEPTPETTSQNGSGDLGSETGSDSDPATSGTSLPSS